MNPLTWWRKRKALKAAREVLVANGGIALSKPASRSPRKMFLQHKQFYVSTNKGEAAYVASCMG